MGWAHSSDIRNKKYIIWWGNLLKGSHFENQRQIKILTWIFQKSVVEMKSNELV
jgi:hypothetical protein